ncbi:MAG TPA: MFS transporter [Ilumatobacter sp.]|nr:MFS transporter [Ilumatobacter sp.]
MGGKRSTLDQIAPNPFAEEQRHTVRALRAIVVPGQAAVAGTLAVNTLWASDLLGSDRLAGTAGSAFTLGSAVVAVPLAAHQRRHGRRSGLTAALATGAVGALVAAAGGEARWFWLYVAGMFVFGAGQAATLQSRYAAADLARADERARAIAAVVWVGTIGAGVGPVLTPLERRVGEQLGFDTYSGPFLFAALLMAIGAVGCFALLRPDPLVTAGGVDPSADRSRPLRDVRASFGVIRRSPGALLGLAALAGSQAAMVAVMTMTPPHMKDHGHADLSAYVIAAHIVGMFGLAPLVGRLVDRVGAHRAIEAGAVVLGLGTVTSVVAGYVPALMFVGLFLLGVGWNVGLIGGTTLLTASVPAAARVEAQGTGDLTLSLCGAVAALASGFVKQSAGFHVLANAATVLAAALLVAAWTTRARAVA